jgi:hypothetical protein
VRLACFDLTLATLTLETHHSQEPAVFDSAVSAFRDKAKDLGSNPVADAIRVPGERLEEIAAALREARSALVAELVHMRGAIDDLIDEARAQISAALIPMPDVPDPMPSPPVPIGEWSALTPAASLHVLTATLRWSREISYTQAAAALGPCYLLSKVIEFPKPQASGLRDIGGEAWDHLKVFLHSAYGSS